MSSIPIAFLSQIQIQSFREKIVGNSEQLTSILKEKHRPRTGTLYFLQMVIPIIVECKKNIYSRMQFFDGHRRRRRPCPEVRLRPGRAPGARPERAAPVLTELLALPYGAGPVG